MNLVDLRRVGPGDDKTVERPPPPLKRGEGYGGSEPMEESGASTHPEDRVGKDGRRRKRDMGERERH